MTSKCFQVDYLDYLDNVGVGSQALLLYPDVILLQFEAFFLICPVMFLQTGEGLQGRSSKSRERAGGNPQGHRRVWRKTVQQTSAEWCEAKFVQWFQIC